MFQTTNQTKAFEHCSSDAKVNDFMTFIAFMALTDAGLRMAGRFVTDAADGFFMAAARLGLEVSIVEPRKKNDGAGSEKGGWIRDPKRVVETSWKQGGSAVGWVKPVPAKWIQGTQPSFPKHTSANSICTTPDTKL